jgi:hypothetical protein
MASAFREHREHSQPLRCGRLRWNPSRDGKDRAQTLFGSQADGLSSLRSGCSGRKTDRKIGGFSRLQKANTSHRYTQMHADKYFVFNPCISVSTERAQTNPWPMIFRPFFRILLVRSIAVLRSFGDSD